LKAILFHINNEVEAAVVDGSQMYVVFICPFIRFGTAGIPIISEPVLGYL
jgi:hypothetical protein